MNQILLPASAPPDETLLILGCIFAGLLGLLLLLGFLPFPPAPLAARAPPEPS